MNTSIRILSDYKGDKPFAINLKEFFARHKKYGSRDRKQIAQLCYSYFRAGHLVKDLSLEDAILTAELLCSNSPSELIATLKPGWVNKSILSPEVKMKELLLKSSLLFPFNEELSPQIDANSYGLSLLVQPNLYLRIRPGHHKSVLAKLLDAGITFQQIGEDCLGFLNTTKIDEVLKVDREVVIQDKSSQQTGEMMKIVKEKRKESQLQLWDCCAGSGGKSILAWDILDHPGLTVSDVRRSILANLDKRFKAAGINQYKSIHLDKEAIPSENMKGKFDLIIADVPCTGSGTWARTPERSYYFNAKEIDEYASLQQKIITNVWSSLKAGGYLLYITCSVFARENEEQVRAFTDRSNAMTCRSEYYKGYNEKADTLYACLLQKPL